MGGLAWGLSFGWTGVKDDVEEVDEDETPEWMSPGRVSCAEDVEAEKNGNEPPEARGERRVGDGDLWAEEVGFEGYSNLREGSNGVPTIWVDGEWRVSPSRLVRVDMPGARRRMAIEGEQRGLL
jgi:hypothetical protein